MDAAVVFKIEGNTRMTRISIRGKNYVIAENDRFAHGFYLRNNRILNNLIAGKKIAFKCVNGR